MFSNLHHAFSTITVSDCADILIVGVFIFCALHIVRRNMHRGVVAAFISLALLHFLARVYHWQLTLRFIEILSFAGLIALTLVFQEDIRRFLESSLFTIFRTDRDQSHSQAWIKVLLKSVETFSKNQIGALIVIQRKNPLEHITRGGHKLNGEMSFPLLCSLFDPHSIGHDGAAIVKGSRITKFGVHLPLSRKHETTGKLGTRHAAALGLSEVSDAFVLVVSEETGDMGIAHHGAFQKTTLEELEAALTALRGRPMKPGFHEVIGRYLKDTWALKATSLLLAMLCWWTLVAPGDLQQRSIAMTVSLEGLPPNLLMDDPIPSEVHVRLEGPEETFANWPREKQVVRIPATGIAIGSHSLPLSPSNLALPNGMKLVNFEPQRLTLAVHETRQVVVPVVLNKMGREPASLGMQVTIHPPEASILVRQGDPGPAFIGSEPIDLSNRQPGERVHLRLLPPPKTKLSPDSPQSVDVTFQ